MRLASGSFCRLRLRPATHTFTISHGVQLLIFAFVPYLSVLFGLFVCRSAWAAIFTYHAGIAAVIFFSKRRVSFRQIAGGADRKLLLLSVGIGAAGGVALFLLWPVLSVPADIAAYLRGIGLTPAAWPIFIAYYAAVNPVLEEYYWRGFLGSDSSRPVLNDFLFGGYHLLVLSGKAGAIWLVALLFILAGAAWYWRQTKRITGGLLPATLSHLAADFTIIYVIFSLTAR